MKKVVTFGEILLRLSTNVGERLLQADQLQLHYGGAEANVGISLSNFGYDVNMVSKLPANALGDAALRHLQSNGVKVDHVLRGGERIGTYYLESGIGERSAVVTYDRKHSSIADIKEDEIDFDSIFEGATLFHVTGITPALSPVLSELTLVALKKAKEHGLMTSFDMNYRAKLWSQKEAADAIKPLLDYVDICSCGELDAVHLLGIPEADDRLQEEEKLAYYYEHIQALYPNIQFMASTNREVLSSTANRLRGNLYVDGALYRSKVHHIEPIVDRVGGGDAFAAGILHGILDGMSPNETITYATAASALKHTIHGDSNIFSKEEIHEFVENGSGKIKR
ncbi:sugar kinase [Sporosarcina ureilytica]|uniref:2-dehydro-3-deoxygluconokinase n=1 Tax=Sporosarcina ureilytica TaxID=298596 RepID=A0A1D8JIU6_9BACL|nr:sugar kinase [Sporosarcina ureilytica]AOV08617.1 2-dehydro-3-deoxygluconokinase [Sporosarcina ureilytica]